MLRDPVVFHRRALSISRSRTRISAAASLSVFCSHGHCVIRASCAISTVLSPARSRRPQSSVASLAASIRRGPSKSARSAARRVAPPVSPSRTSRMKSGASESAFDGVEALGPNVLRFVG